jgi:hypothetical protein
MKEINNVWLNSKNISNVNQFSKFTDYLINSAPARHLLTESKNTFFNKKKPVSFIQKSNGNVWLHIVKSFR